MSHETEVTERPRRGRRRGLALVAAGALLLSGPLVAGAVAADTIQASSDEPVGDYVGPNRDEYGTINVKSGELEAVTSSEAGKLALFAKDGAVHAPVLIQQLEVKGDGEFQVLDPAPATLPKNLNGFSPAFVDIVNRDGEEPTEEQKDAGATYANIEDSVDGGTNSYRWLGILEEERIPFTMEPTYILDGKTYDNPDDMVGKSGEVEVRFKWNAIGATETTLYFLDGDGNPVQNTGPVYLPLVGVFKVPVPGNFTNVRPITMDAAPDGFGGTLMAGTLVMAPPLGPVEITTGFRADVEDFYMPTALVEWVLVNPPDNASFAVIGQLLGTLGGSLTGASSGLAATGQSLNQLSQITDAVGGLFNGLTDVQGVIQQLQSFSTDAIQGVNQINGALGGAIQGVLSVNEQLRGLLVGDQEDPGPIAFLQKMFNQRLAGEDSEGNSISDNVARGLNALEQCPTGTGDDFKKAPVNTLINLLAAAAQDASVRQLLESLGLGSVLPLLDQIYEANPVYPVKCGVASLIDPQASLDPGSIPGLAACVTGWLLGAECDARLGLDGAIFGPITGMLIALAAPATGTTAAVPGGTLGPTDPRPIGPVLGQLLCDALGLKDGQLIKQCQAAKDSTVSLSLTVAGTPAYTYQDAPPIDYLIQAIKGKVVVLLLGLTDAAIGVISTIQGKLTEVTSGIAQLGTVGSGINTAIGQISTTINSVVFNGLSGLLGGLSGALPSLGSSLSSAATTLNYEFAIFNAYAFMGTLGGAQPYGPPWSGADIAELTVDPKTGAVVSSEPPTAGAPLDGGETQPAAGINPVPAEPPAFPSAEGDPTIQAIDKAGYTAYQVDLLGFGGERGVNAGLYFAAIAAILIGGIVGGLIMKARK